ncbi:uncharacterized protein LOC117510126 [Thalassophryne amazonica]|uniref:uncharacterized protein LOC117510126 n=1 Tax=Thalassophryne amazonica TaxID=390379 RepID=UPI00147210AE|nr:uncharacterized protein LOC117510126 [Thalassophryne amazonica]
MSKRLTRLVTRGKRGRKVPILLLERTKESLDFMVEKRSEVGILEENPFLFARHGTTTNLRGCDCLRKFAEESKANNPELLRSAKLRKHVATLCQLLDLSNQELEQVARFMGHDIRVHYEYYRQTDKTFQVAKIGKLLFAMEHGANSLKDKSLQTLDSVISSKRPAATSTKRSQAVKKRRISDARGQLEEHDDGEQLSSTSSSAQGKKMTVPTPRDDSDEASAAMSSVESLQQDVKIMVVLRRRIGAMTSVKALKTQLYRSHTQLLKDHLLTNQRGWQLLNWMMVMMKMAVTLSMMKRTD